jgi:hypothetical protein
MDDLIIALAGGAIGSALTTVARLSAVPGEVVLHDRLIADRDADLERYVVDEYLRLVFTLVVDLDQKGREQGWPNGELEIAKMRTVDASIHAYRDEELRAERARLDLLGRESWAHWLWRRRRPWKKVLPRELEIPTRAVALIDKWGKLAPTKDGKQYTITDPRKRTLDHVLGGEEVFVRPAAEARSEQES